jgi:UDP-N-acetylglucosamine 2-epimerase (non-hydrolysing)
MIHVFIGTKAQLIKMAPIMQELQNRDIEYNFIFSGQHQDTIDDLRKNFGIKEPDIILHKGKDITGIIQMVAWAIKIFIITLYKRNEVWRNDKCGIVLNHGDTFSTLLGTLLARIHRHKSAHIESGLRSFDIFNPFPEELTRIIVFSLSNYYYCPNNWALDNLLKYKGNKVVTNGNTLYDALQTIKMVTPPTDLDIPTDDFAIASFHRFENIFKEDNLRKIVDIIITSTEKIKIVVIAHKPTLKKLEEFGLINILKQNKNIILRPRYDYLRFMKLVIASKFVMTDGGSNQEECNYIGKPCLIIRNATERLEGLNENAVLSKFDADIINDFINNYTNFKKEELTISPSPTQIIVNHLVENSTQH